MAALSQPEGNSDRVTSSAGKENELFMPKETPDKRCDVILVVEDDKEFKAHKQVLSDASPFFEKLLNSDMKESREGIVRLEMFSESAMRNTLQFIYTGNVQILAEDNARDLVVSADYLFLSNLKTLAEGALVKILNTSNCISCYYFSQRYQCEELLAKSVNYIVANFTAVYETNREEVLNMSSKEMEMWLSSDETNVGAEEDVFKIILAWIDHDRNKRKTYFVELFRSVRLVFVSRDFLISDIQENDLVKDNESCVDRVVDAINLKNDALKYRNVSISPRKSLKRAAVVVTGAVIPNDNRAWKMTGVPVLCFFPCEGRWYKLAECSGYCGPKIEFFCCRGKLHPYSKWTRYFLQKHTLPIYNAYSNCSRPIESLGMTAREHYWQIRETFVVNDDEMYALDSVWRSRYGIQDVASVDMNKYFSCITKYKVESNSWEDVTSFDHLNARANFCIVAKDDFVYFIGGEKIFVERHGMDYEEVHRCYTDVDRYNLSRNQWDKVADILRPKTDLSGAACNGRIFIAGNVKGECDMFQTCQCEVYSETTNEWQFIANFNFSPEVRPKLFAADDNLYAFGSYMWNEGDSPPDTKVESYDPDKNEWILKADIPFRTHSNTKIDVSAFSVRIFKGSNYQRKSINSPIFFPLASPTKARKGKCVIM